MSDKQKKVLFVATVASHIRAFHLPYLKLFQENGYKTYVAGNWNIKGQKKLENCDEFVQISIQRSPYSLDNLKAIKELKKVINEERFDVIHCHTPMGAVVARLAAKKARKKNGTRVIYTAHGFHFYDGAPLRNWLLFYPVEWYLAKYVDTLITINKEDYDRAKKKFGHRCKDIQYVLGVGVDPKKFKKKMDKKEKLAIRKSLGISDNDKVLIFPAELSGRKNQMWLINTLSPLFKKDGSYHLLLPGGDSLNGKCHALVKELGLENQVHLLGFRSDIPELMHISDLAVSSSKQEGLPVNIMEAIATGKPVVALDCRGVRDLIKDGNNGYVVNNAREMLDKILLLKDNKKLVGEISKNNKVKIKNYSLDSVMKKMKKIYFGKGVL